MSTPNQQNDLDPNSLLYYAPRKLRDSSNDPPSLQPLSDTVGQPKPHAFVRRRLGLDDAALQDSLPESLRHLVEAEAKSRSAGRKRTFALAASLAAAASITVGIVFLDTSKFTRWLGWSQATKESEISLADRLQPANAAFDLTSQKTAAPTIAVRDNGGGVNAPLPLGVEIANFPPGATLTVTGLLVGASMSSGAASGNGEWRIAAADVANTRVVPPLGYVGPMTLVAELRGGNGQPIVRSHVRYTWTQPVTEPAKTVALTPARAAAPAAPTPAAAAAAEESAAPRQMDQKEVDALMKKASELLSSGDLPAARLLLRRIADTHNARAAYELGASYDPAVIKKLGVISIAPDLAQARTWYQKARDWGSADASKQLDALASADNK